MPNYVKNILSFDGDPDQVSRLFSAIKGENVLAPGDRDHILSGVFNQFLSALTEPVE